MFLVTLPGGYARGVVARVAPRGLILGYFFGPRVASSNLEWAGLHPKHAILVGRLGDLHLIKGRWPVVGKIEGWDRKHWPVPSFAWRDPLRCLPDHLVHYSDDDIATPIREDGVPVPAGLNQDGLMGAGFVEKKLERLLAGVS